MGNKSSHILATSSNLLGFSFLVLSSIKSLGIPQTGIIDEIVTVLIIILAISCLFSFLSIRAKDQNRAEKNELIADYLFLSSLFIITFTAILTAFDYLIFNR